MVVSEVLDGERVKMLPGVSDRADRVAPDLIPPQMLPMQIDPALGQDDGVGPAPFETEPAKEEELIDRDPDPQPARGLNILLARLEAETFQAVDPSAAGVAPGL